MNSGEIVSIGVDMSAVVQQYRSENARLKKLLREIAEERDRYKSLWESNRIQNEISDEERKANRRIDQERKQERLLSGVKSDGVPIAHAADSVRSYDELCVVLDKLKTTGRMGIRNWAMFRCGVCFGLRASDLTKLKWGWIVDEAGNFKERIPVVEAKTSKVNNCLISEAIVETLAEYREWLKNKGREIEPDDYVFSKNNGDKLQEQSFSRILKSAGIEAGLPIHISSHTMRKSFANIVLCIHDGGAKDDTIRDIQGMLGHADVRVTMRYLHETILRYDTARKEVSDFVLGKTDVNELFVAKKKSNDDIYDVCMKILEEVA